MKLVMYITICDATMIMSSTGMISICRVETYKLLAATMFFSQSYQAQFESLAMLFQVIYGLVFPVAFHLSFAFNAALCWDLIIVLHNPFKSAEARLKTYVIIGFSMVVVFAIILNSL